MDDAFKLWRAHENSAESMGIELESADATLLRFSPPRPVVMAYGNGWHDEIKAHESTAALGPLARFRTAAQSILCQIQQSRSWDHQAARSRIMRSYAAIGILAALDDMSWGEDEPSFLSPQEQRELQRLRIVLAPRDLAFCRARADLALRHSRVVHAQSSCAGCHRCPIVGPRFDCLDCENREHRPATTRSSFNPGRQMHTVSVKTVSASQSHHMPARLTSFGTTCWSSGPRSRATPPFARSSARPKT